MTLGRAANVKRAPSFTSIVELESQQWNMFPLHSLGNHIIWASTNESVGHSVSHFKILFVGDLIGTYCRRVPLSLFGHLLSFLLVITSHGVTSQSPLDIERWLTLIIRVTWPWVDWVCIYMYVVGNEKLWTFHILQFGRINASPPSMKFWPN